MSNYVESYKKLIDFVGNNYRKAWSVSLARKGLYLVWRRLEKSEMKRFV